MKRAFTLIELLVVIAIIAILAAILFPVFTQAKEQAKKTQALSNTKQTALGIIQYLVDSDDVYPLSHRLMGSQLRSHETPAGWGTLDAERYDGILWGNSIQPYLKNYEVTTGPGVLPTNIAAYGYPDPSRPRAGRRPRSTSMSMNGLLHAYSASAVTQPSKLTLVWWGNMREDLPGFAYTNPNLGCGSQQAAGHYYLMPDCRFNPGGRPSTNATGQNDYSLPPYDGAKDSAWVQGRGMCYVSCDGSAKWRGQNQNGQPTPTGRMYTSYEDPTMTYNTKGQQFRYHRCQIAGTSNALYLSFFRPDSEFNYQFGNTSSTRCTQ